MIQDLPTLPATHARALALVGRNDVEIGDLARVVEADPALTIAVLRAANSAASAPAESVNTAQTAIVRIGLESTKHIVTSAVVGDAFSGLDTAGIDAGELWRHLIACALLSDVTAWGRVQNSNAFTAGLLHDVGRLAMAQAEPERYAKVTKLMQMRLDPLEAEQRIFGYNHLEMGIRVARSWEVPEEMVEAIGDHHSGDQGPLAWVVWNSRRVVWSLGFGDGVERPESVTFDPKSEDAQLVEALGGVSQFLETIDWYRGAVTARAA